MASDLLDQLLVKPETTFEAMQTPEPASVPVMPRGQPIRCKIKASTVKQKKKKKKKTTYLKLS